MDKKEKSDGQQQPASANDANAVRQQTEEAHRQADRDMEQDADLSISSPNDDLDEGETARLGDGPNPLV